jgi:DNA primase
MKIDKNAIRYSAGIEAYRKRLPDLSKDGKRFKARCPIHADSRPSLTIDLKDGVYLWHCFPCNLGGDIFALVQKMDNCDFADAVKAVASGAGPDLKPAPTPKPTPKRKFDRRKAERDIKKYQTALAVQIEAWEADPFIEDSDVPAVIFLRKRGVSFAVAKELGFGYSQWNNALAMPSYGQDVKTGRRDELIGIKFRSVEAQPKYKWTCVPESESDILYGTHLSHNWDEETWDVSGCAYAIFVVESQLDAALIRSLGHNAIALHNRIVPATKRFARDIQHLENFYDHIIYVGDNDEAGRDAMLKLSQIVQQDRFMRLLPEGFKDIGDMYAADPDAAKQWLTNTKIEVGSDKTMFVSGTRHYPKGPFCTWSDDPTTPEHNYPHIREALIQWRSAVRSGKIGAVNV